MSFIKKLRRNINRNIIMIFIVILVTVGALGLVLLLLSGNQERNSVPVDPKQSSLTEKETTEPQELEGVSARAKTLFAARVQSIESIAEVAALLETMELRKSIGEYTVEVDTAGGAKSMIIAFDKTVDGDGKIKEAFDKRMKEKAQLILALVADAEEIQWTYRVKTKDNKEEIVADSYTTKSGSPSGDSDIKELGKSAKSIDRLLKLQGVEGI